MSVSQEPPKLEHRANTLAEKLFKRIDQKPERQPKGFVLTDLENTRQGAGIRSLLFGGIFQLIWGIIFMIVGMSNPLFFFFGLVPVLSGINTFWAIPTKLKTLNRANPGELILQSYPLRLGETMVVTFRRHLQSGYEAKTTGKVWGRLVCLEVYRDDRGSGSASFYGEYVWCYDLPPLTVLPGVSRIEQDWAIDIPSAGVPTIRIENSNESNFVLWCIDVWLEIPGLIKDDSVFCLLVEPEVV